MKTKSLEISGISDPDSITCPFPLAIIPNHMGINLCSVQSVIWQQQDDGQLVSLSIYFIPETQKEN